MNQIEDFVQLNNLARHIIAHWRIPGLKIMKVLKMV